MAVVVRGGKEKRETVTSSQLRMGLVGLGQRTRGGKSPKVVAAKGHQQVGYLNGKGETACLS